MSYVINPKTGRPIKRNGPTYKAVASESSYYARKLRDSKRLSKPKARGTAPSAKSSKGRVRSGTSKLSAGKSRSLKTSLRTSRAPYLKRNVRSLLKHEGEGRGSATRGWRATAPRRGRDRHELSAKCGKSCFLGSNESFPVCPRCLNNKCSCKIDCRGVVAAKIRARQYGYGNIASSASRILKSKCGY